MSVEETIKALPKLEQHVHIVGSTKPETLLWLIEDSGADLPYESVEDLEQFYRYKDFPHFLNIYSTVNCTITKESHYERLTYEMMQSQAGCNVKHVEAIYSAWDHVGRGLDFSLMVDSINRGIRKATRDFGVTCTIRIDLVRNYGPEVGMKVLDLIEEKSDNIIAIDTGGSEEGFPPAPYKECYDRAREMGLHVVAHQGEGAGTDYIWECLEYLNPERIGHAVAAGEDTELMKTIAAKGIPIECCPVSNIRTGAVKDLSRHPIRSFMDHGIKVSVNSDDPPMFGTTMNNEYIQLHQKLGFTIEELFKISLDAVETSFLCVEEKERLLKQFQMEYARLI
ncbi:MAG: adenosine deaminase [Candidatus Bathyarchaeota archaeon]|nr:adenosine deaminase [Candidatus Bathyarchaeota archaeon]